MKMLRNRGLWAAVLVVLLSGGLFGCAQFSKLKEVEPAETAPTTRYYDFEDIQVPTDLKLDPRQSFVYDTEGFKAGTLYFSGYVEVDSLVAFFSDAMVRDGWRLRSTFRYPKMLLLFEKKEKVCLIMIYEKLINTYVEIWVAPTV